MAIASLTCLLALSLVACAARPSGPSAPAQPRQSAAPGSSSTPQTPATAAYVAIGASDAYGVGATDPLRDNWPTLLAHQLGGPFHIVNLGIPGATMALARRDELPIALDARPSLVTLWLGVNDLDNHAPIPAAMADLRAMLNALRQQTTASIFVGNLPDLTLLPYFAQRDPLILRQQVDDWNAALTVVCLQTGATVVDINLGWDALATHPEYISSDGLHPSTIGSAKLAAIFANTIHTARTATPTVPTNPSPALTPSPSATPRASALPPRACPCVASVRRSRFTLVVGG